VLPDGGEQSTATAPSTSSTADAAYETDTPAGLVAFATMLEGTVITGGASSSGTSPNVMSRLTVAMTSSTPPSSGLYSTWNRYLPVGNPLVE
jgi:hypothetical protein